MSPTLNLDTLILKHGAHESPEEGLCVMEAVAFLAHEEHSDAPACASKVVSAFLRSWNDSLGDIDRQMLKQFIPRLVGSAGPEEVEVRRARLAQDWCIRTFTPTWLELAGLSDHAETLRKLNTITSDADIEAARGSLSAAWRAAERAAESAALSAAWSAAMSAAEEALAPTVKRLQASAIDLVNCMLEVR